MIRHLAEVCSLNLSYCSYVELSLEVTLVLMKVPRDNFNSALGQFKWKSPLTDTTLFRIFLKKSNRSGGK